VVGEESPGPGSLATPRSIMTAWMNSEGHREHPLGQLLRHRPRRRDGHPDDVNARRRDLHQRLCRRIADDQSSTRPTRARHRRAT
jgi:hypothetical protein